MGARIVSAVRLGPSQLDRLADWDVVIVDFKNACAADIDDALGSAEGLIVNSHVTADASLLERAPGLRVVSTVSVGFDHIDLDVAARRKITVTTTPVLSDAVADLTMALMLMTARKLGEAVLDLAEGRWSNGLLGTDLRDKTLLIIGFGRIGREVAARAQAAKMHVCAYDARSDIPGMPGVTWVDTLGEALAHADIVSLHVDLNPSTRHLLDGAAFALMKPTAIVINTARGGVVDQTALTTALAEGQIAGAGLDVLATEPPGADDPLLSMPNVVVLPHIGSATVETRLAMLDCAIDNVAACMRGEECEHALRLEVG
jgi:glyoxylate reductase